MSVHYVPAGGEAYSRVNLQLAITNKPNAKEVTYFGDKYKEWQTLDRTVALVAKSHVNGRNVKATADVVVPLYNSTFIQACGLTKVLANPIHGPFVKAPFEAKGIESIIDSGGFQLAKETVTFVDPDEVARGYNTTASIGMPLDLPVRAKVEDTFFDPVTLLIKANDERILSQLNKGISLALISHGSTLSYRKRRLDVLDRPADVVAVAGLQHSPLHSDKEFNNVENLMYVLHRYRKTTRYFHVLGVTSKLWLFVYSVIDALGYVKEIGGDSVSHRLGALVGEYDTPDFEAISLKKAETYRQQLSCNCPICVSIDDTRIIHNSLLLECHNLWVRSHQTQTLGSMARSYVAGTLPLRVVYDALRLRIGMSKFQHIVHYVEEIIASGKYRPIKAEKTNKSLFASVRPSGVSRGPMYDHYVNVLRRYEKFHKQKFLR